MGVLTVVVVYLWMHRLLSATHLHMVATAQGSQQRITQAINNPQTGSTISSSTISDPLYVVIGQTPVIKHSVNRRENTSSLAEEALVANMTAHSMW